MYEFLINLKLSAAAWLIKSLKHEKIKLNECLSSIQILSLSTIAASLNMT